MYFIFHVTSQDHPIVVSCKFMGASSLQYDTTLKSLVKNINLINVYYNWKIELIEETLGKKTNVATSKMYILIKSFWNLKSILYFHFMTAFYNFAPKIEISLQSWS